VRESARDDDSGVLVTEIDWCLRCGYEIVTSSDGEGYRVGEKGYVSERVYRNIEPIVAWVTGAVKQRN
jgi:hypothetical protein